MQRHRAPGQARTVDPAQRQRGRSGDQPPERVFGDLQGRTVHGPDRVPVLGVGALLGVGAVAGVGPGGVWLESGARRGMVGTGWGRGGRHGGAPRKVAGRRGRPRSGAGRCNRPTTARQPGTPPGAGHPTTTATTAQQQRRSAGITGVDAGHGRRGVRPRRTCAAASAGPTTSRQPRDHRATTAQQPGRNRATTARPPGRDPRGPDRSRREVAAAVSKIFPGRCSARRVGHRFGLLTGSRESSAGAGVTDGGGRVVVARLFGGGGAVAAARLPLPASHPGAVRTPRTAGSPASGGPRGVGHPPAAP